MYCDYSNFISQTLSTPDESHPNIFTYFNPAGDNIPAGSPLASKGVIYMSTNIGIGLSDSSSFLIQTFRKDNLVSMCLAGHTVRGLFAAADNSPSVGYSVHFNVKQGGDDFLRKI